jgi:hypothetical protein
VLEILREENRGHATVAELPLDQVTRQRGLE